MNKIRLAICITVHFSAERLVYLEAMVEHFTQLCEDVEVFIVTNANPNNGEQKLLDDVLKEKGFKYHFFTPIGIGHPFLLTWSHFDVFKKLINDGSISHFMYLEDDLLVTKDNFDYWQDSLQTLQPLGLIPSFFRIEKKKSDSKWYSSDVKERFLFRKLPKVYKNQDYAFINLPHPYQGMYLLTRELMIEHLNSPSSNPDFGIWGIRERAGHGLTFQNIPNWCTSRNFLGFNVKTGRLDPRSFIHHLPNNYVNRDKPDGNLGTIQVDEVIIMPHQETPIKNLLGRIIKKLKYKNTDAH